MLISLNTDTSYLLTDLVLLGSASVRCAEFEDILSPWDVYSLVALTAYHSGYMGVCSRWEDMLALNQ